MINFLGKKHVLGEKNYLKMNNAFLPSKKIMLKFEANILNIVFFNFKKKRNKKLSQFCTYFQTRRVETQN